MSKNKITKQGTVSAISLSTYTSPKIIEEKNKDYVLFGQNNSYYQYIIDRYNGSPTNGALINAISAMIYGKGLDATDSARRPAQYAEMKSLFKKESVKRFAYDLKLFGQCAIQVAYSNDRKRIIKVEHIPVQTLAPEKIDGTTEIQAYYYHPDWAKKKPSDKPKRISAFGVSKKPAELEILFVKSYQAGMYYFSLPDYQGILQYSELEKEIGNFHLNNILNGMSPSFLINFNNGTPDERTQSMIENKIKNKFGGTSNSGKAIISFNDNADAKADITPVQLSDADKQYTFLSTESQSKILVGHRVTSPILFGIKDNTGFGNNAEEMKTASILMNNTVIKPFQEQLTDAFDRILAFNDINLNLYFKTLQPLEFTDMENIKDEETKEEETGVKMTKLFSELEALGEDENEDEWELIDEREVDYEMEGELNAEIEVLNEVKPSLLKKIYNLATTGTARGNAKSEQDRTVDGINFKVRYQYAPLTASSNSREFCKKMVAAKKIYRKEDIDMMSQNAVNAGFGVNGADNYDIWLYKGSGNCHHYWMRKTYRAVNTSPDVKNPRSIVSVSEAKKEGLKPVVNDSKVATRPVDMPNNGFKNKK